MPIQLQCPSCGRRHAAGDHLAGTMARCPCGAALQIPRPQPVAPSVIRCNCPGCGRQHAVGMQMAGQQARCGCGTIMVVPRPAGAFADPLDDMLKIDGAAAMLAQTTLPVSNPYWAKQMEAEERQRESKRRRKQKNVPPAVNTACWGLAMPGAISIVIAIVGVICLAAGARPADWSNTVIFVILGYHVIAGIGACAVSFMIAQRIVIGRYLGFVVAVIYLCGSPLHMIAGIAALVGLASAEMTEFMED